MDGLNQHLADWAVASRAHTGETVSGDGWWVEQQPDGVRAAVADGLGHGPEAAAAASRALALVRAEAARDLAAVMKRCHAGLQRTRGVALSLLRLDAAAGTVTWLGVGNVTCLLVRPDRTRSVVADSLRPARGVLGRRLPPLKPCSVPVSAGDVLVLTTDGVDARFQHELPGLEPLQRAADTILERFAAGHDDALVMTLRWRGANP